VWPVHTVQAIHHRHLVVPALPLEIVAEVWRTPLLVQVERRVTSGGSRRLLRSLPLPHACRTPLAAPGSHRLPQGVQLGQAHLQVAVLADRAVLVGGHGALHQRIFGTPDEHLHLLPRLGAVHSMSVHSSWRARSARGARGPRGSRGGGSQWRRWPPLAAQSAVGVKPTR
jgi:hypothetical protein